MTIRLSNFVKFPDKTYVLCCRNIVNLIDDLLHCRQRSMITGASAMENPKGSGPLAGVRVVEMGQLIAGPFCGQLLGDMGAEIV